MQDMKKNADQYIAQHLGMVNPQYKPAYHAAVPTGWLNDPNGFIFYQGKYHLFYQFHPYSTQWGPMHWGHWTSHDLVRWQDLPVAMAPDKPYDDMGCFSGTAITRENTLYLMYTGVHKAGGIQVQEQCIAQSQDGVHFTKWDQNPVISSEDLPADVDPADFRDPKVLKTPRGEYLCIVAAKGREGGKLLTYASPNLSTWTLRGTALADVGIMPECPDLFDLDGTAVLLSSVIGLQDEGYGVPCEQVSVYMLGTMDDQTGRYTQRILQPLDYGPSFYAPQTLLDSRGRRIMIAWMKHWKRDPQVPTHTLGHDWNGMMTLPRVLSLEDGRLRQRPVEELAALRRNEVAYEQVPILGVTVPRGLCGRHKELEIDLLASAQARVEIRLLEEGEEYLSLVYDAAAGRLTMDRSACGHPVGEGENVHVAHMPLSQKDGRVTLQVFIDTSSVEVFANDGEAVLSAICFPRLGGMGVSFRAEGEASLLRLKKWDLSPT